MTVVSDRRLTSAPSSYATLSAVYIDQLTEAVMMGPDPQSRSAVIASVVAELVETIRWLHGPDTESEELTSLLQVLAAAEAHQVRMAAAAPEGEKL